jgi:NADH-quinone oxidoreductase subunit M
MNIFVGAFQHDDTFHRVLTVLVVSSIVITAVYILRMIGKIMMGPLSNEEYKDLPKATWYEKTGLVLLMVPVVLIGVMPFGLGEMIKESIEPFLERLL